MMGWFIAAVAAEVSVFLVVLYRSKWVDGR